MASHQHLHRGYLRRRQKACLPHPRRPLSYAMSCIFILPSTSRRTLNGSAIVAIGAYRDERGSDNVPADISARTWKDAFKRCWNPSSNA